jgi:Putative prokaryotic signal transducing protein
MGSARQGVISAVWSSLRYMEPEEGVVLTVVSGEPEADVVCGLLRSAGIDCAYRDTEAIESSLEEFTATGPREILVRAADLDAARELLAASTS